MMLVCPRCHELIDPDERCTTIRGLGRCMEMQGHDGYHWSDMGRGDGGVTIWTGLFSKHSCAGRISLSQWCQKKPGHDGPHHDGHGVSWEEAECDDPG